MLKLRIVEVLKRLRRTLLLVMLSVLVGLLSLLSASFESSSLGEYKAIEPSSLPPDPQVVRATDELHHNLSLSIERVTGKVKDLINEASDNAELQFKQTVHNPAYSTQGLSGAIQRTLLEDLSNSLKES